MLAVADGIVSHTGLDGGYGRLIEITHGNGYVTRYAHNAKLLVKPGQTVKRGDAIALMGSTGRSTGTHVHFEVLRDGRPMNPLSFVTPLKPARTEPPGPGRSKLPVFQPVPSDALFSRPSAPRSQARVEHLYPDIRQP